MLSVAAVSVGGAEVLGIPLCQVLTIPPPGRPGSGTSGAGTQHPVGRGREPQLRA
jgi:hypothetical protein